MYICICTCIYICICVNIFMYTYMYLYMNIHVYSYKYLMYSHIYGKRMVELRSNALREQMVSERRNAVSKSRVVCFPRTTQVVIWLRHCFSTAKRHQHEFFFCATRSPFGTTFISSSVKGRENQQDGFPCELRFLKFGHLKKMLPQARA